MKNSFNKSKVNLLIDIIMFVLLMAIAGIGFLIKFILLPGFKRNEIYGNGIELYFAGLDRHQWGTIHLIISFSFLFLLIFHIILHWSMIVSIFRKMVSRKAWRIILTSIFIIVSLIFSVVPLLIKPAIAPAVSHQSNTFGRQQRQDTYKKLEQSEKKIIQPEPEKKQNHKKVEQQQELKDEHDNEEAFHDIEIYGYMTLADLSKEYNISTKELASCIKVPEGNEDVRLGWLKKDYDFHLNDLRKYIDENRE